MKISTKKYIKKYLNIDNINNSTDNNSFTIHKEDTLNEFLNSLECFNNILDSVYYKNGIMLYIFNDYLLTFNRKFEEIKALYSYAECNKQYKAKKYLGNFLLAYQFSLESDVYKELSDYGELSKTFYSVFDRRDFYNDGKYITDSLDFMIDIISCDEIEYDANFYFDNIDKLYQRAKDNNKYHQLFHQLLIKKKSLSKFFEYDYDYDKHQSTYNEYVIDNSTELMNSYKFESALELLVKLYKNSILEKQSYKAVLNKVIYEINEIIDQWNRKINNSILFISFVDQIISTLVTIKKCKNYYKEYEEKIEECIKVVLFCKRSYVKDEKIKDGMAVVENEFVMDQDKWDLIEEKLLNNLQNVFVYLKLDFDSVLENAIRTHSSYPLLDLVSEVSIDTEKGTYFNWVESKQTSFSKFYNEKGKEIVESLKNELTNIYTGNFYYLMIRQISKTFTMSGQILRLRFKDIFDKKLRSYICEEILGVNDDIYKNDYILCTYLILCVESIIYDQMLESELEFQMGKMTLNLEKLFDCYQNDKLSRDVYMFVNYIMYDEYGMKYRNNFMHGNYVHKEDLTVELLYIFSTVIGLLIVGDRNGK